MALVLSAFSWLFNLICEPGRDRLEDQNIFDDDSGSSPSGVVLAEQPQSFASFLSELFSLLSRSLGSHPPSIHLMGLPALPASLAREKRSRFVSSRALQALAKTGPGPDPAAEEDCYICLRPVGTKNLPSSASTSEKANLSGFGAAARKACEGSETDDEAEADEEGGAGEKGCFEAAPGGRQRRHGDDGEDAGDEQLLKQEQQEQQQQQQRQRRHGSSSREGSSSPRSSSAAEQQRRKRQLSILRLPCGHRFCDCCLRRWLSSHSSCPTCRWEFPHKDCETAPKEF